LQKKRKGPPKRESKRDHESQISKRGRNIKRIADTTWVVKSQLGEKNT